MRLQSVRQLDRQISSQFYERTALSRDKAAMLHGAQTPAPEDNITPEQAIKDPFVLEFFGLSRISTPNPISKTP